MNPKILLLLTGGTIGSADCDGVISTAQKYRIAELYTARYGNDADLVIVQPLNILSENLNCSHWETMVNFLCDFDFTDFDGVIITHGSDTLSYTSAMLGLTLNSLPLPIVITAANYVPDDSRSNALANFRAAVRLIQVAQKGVYTVYQNDGDDFVTVYSPTSLHEADRFFDRFFSVDHNNVGIVRNDKLMVSKTSLLFEQMQAYAPIYKLKKLSLNRRVMMIHPYPSLDYEHLLLPENTAAVLHITYHSATASADKNNSALSLLKRCQDKGIDFYLASFKAESRSVYESNHILLENGAIPLYDISDESAYAKLLLIYNDFLPKDSVHENVYFEKLS